MSHPHERETVINESTSTEEASAPLSRVQTDLFCAACGANLFGQGVWRTGEADILVADCPRCGKVHPANDVLPYRRVWRQRLGITLMLGWMALLGFGAVMTVVFEFVLLMETPVITRTFKGHRYGHGVYSSSLDKERTIHQLPIMIATGALLGFGATALGVSTVYHWRKRWHLLTTVIAPLIALVFVYLEGASPFYKRWWPQAFPWIMVILATLVLSGIAGVFFGRPFVRWCIRILLPAKARKYFGFLWRRDGKEMPAGMY